jgi:hypothetical protein
MTSTRRLLVLPVLLLVAACDNGAAPPPAPAPPPAVTPAPSTPAAAATPAPVATRPVAAATAAQIAPMVGTWAADLNWCASGGAGTPITITETSFQGAENSCTIGGFTDKGDGSFDAALSCVAEGQTKSETLNMVPLFAPTGEGIKISYPDRGGDPVVVLRCP